MAAIRVWLDKHEASLYEYCELFSYYNVCSLMAQSHKFDVNQNKDIYWDIR